MTGILTITPGSPNWWLSPDIWVTKVGSSTAYGSGTQNPIEGETYNVSVRVHDNYPPPNSVPGGSWNLFVCWMIPTTGPFPTPTGAQVLNNGPIVPSVAAMGHADLQTAMTWTPSFENGGHECLIAAAYGTAFGEGLPSSLDANPADRDTNQGYLSIAQHNLGVLSLGSMMGGMRIRYRFQVCNGFDEEREFVVRARQVPLSEIDHFLPGVPGGRTVLDKPGKVEHLGLVASAKPDPKELEAASAVLARVRIEPRSCRQFTLGGKLERGNALINVTQSLGERVVGGLSVLVLSEAK
ncbi:MAG TPA: hypothetical protein VGR45_10325 [Stellaceae bacterium]|nr:hypothetical protein [Stellaceae bacterium]